jgi:hypothetical protein
MADAKDKKDAKAEDSEAGEKVAVTVTKHAMMTEAPADVGETTEAKPAAPEKKDVAVPSTSKLKIEPISKPEDLKPEEDKQPEASADSDASSEDGSDDSPTGRDKLKDVSQDEQDLMEKKAAEHQANLNKIAVAKTYFLPINQVVRRRSKQVAIAGTVLAVLLGLAWLDVSMDAGLISVPGVKPVTHFFSK